MRQEDHKNKEDSINKDKFKVKCTKFKGELKRQWGKFTDDDLMQIEGDYDKFLVFHAACG